MTSQRRSSTYEPRGKTKKILERALEHIHSVPYKVSGRFIFYRLLQEGYFSKKGDAAKFEDYTGRARHAFWNGWHPTILADETRDAVVRGDGYSSVGEWLRSITFKPRVDFFRSQDFYFELWFEARGMRQQFEQYSNNITLMPFGGQISITLKGEAAERLSEIDKPIRVLYFGDLDFEGAQIARIGYEDVLKWCDNDFELLWVGLTMDQVNKYNIPENPDKPGDYQWVALTDEAAGEIITATLDDHIDLEAMAETTKTIDQAQKWLDGKLEELADEWKSKNE